VLQLTKMMYDNGVEILSGTDIPNFGLSQVSHAAPLFPTFV
jgi:hypothetical protein